MQNLIELKNEELKQYLNELYSSFDNGYEFEEFLKLFLERLGLEEVCVTPKSRDGGIDLTCTKSGVAGLSELDETRYYIQAKCFKPSSTISIKDLRELRGVMPNNYKGIFITTAKFSKDAEVFADDKDRPIILIDGINLIRQCINIGLGFNYKPVFDKTTLEKTTLKKNNIEIEEKQEITKQAFLQVSRKISQNDIRARILRIPTEIVKLISESIRSVDVTINNKLYHLNINAERTYLGGVTQIYKNLGLIQEDNVYISKLSIWQIIDGKIIVDIKELN